MSTRHCHLISLGYDCEPSFQISFYSKYFESFPFSWSYSFSRRSLLDCIKEISLISKGEAIPFFGHGRMLYFSEGRVALHLRPLSGKNDFDPFSIGELQELKSRSEHLVSKFKDVLTSSDNKIFIYKIQATNFLEDQAFLESLFEALKKVSNGEVLLIPVFSKEQINIKQYRSISRAGIRPYFVNHFWKNGVGKNVYSGDCVRWLHLVRHYIRGNSLRYWYTVNPFLRKLLSPFINKSKGGQ